MVIKLDALGDKRIIGSRFLPVVAEGETTVGVPFIRERKYCLAARETELKSVGLVPRRIVRRDVIVRSLEWIRKTAALRPLTGTDCFVGVAVTSSVATGAEVSSTMGQKGEDLGDTDIIR